MEQLKINEVTKNFGGLCAISDLCFSTQKGDITGIIGPNGAGKTTLFNMICGVYAPNSGDIVLEGQSVVGLRPHKINSLGIARTFQVIRLFPKLSVLSNVLVGKYSWELISLKSKAAKKAEGQNAIAQTEEILRYVGLEERKDELAMNLSHGEMRLLELGRALATSPKLLLMDEQASGLSASEVDNLKRLVREIRDSGITILIIEHLMDFVMDLSDHVIVLNYGQKIFEGTPEEAQNDQEVITAYLGKEVDL